MASQYSMNGFIQSIDDYTYLEKYFQNRGIKDFTYTVGTEKKSRKKTSEEVLYAITEILSSQSEDIQQEIERDFAEINKLSDDKGIDSLINEAKDQSISPSLAVLDQNGHDLSFWFFNNHKEVFDEASAVQEFLTSGWKRVPVPSKNIEIVTDRKDVLEEKLKKYYQNKDKGLGQYSSIEIYPKKDRVYVVVRISARGVNDVIPDEANIGKLKKSTRRDSINIYFLYLQGDTADGGELEIKTKGGYTTQRELLGVFSSAVLDHTLDDTKQKYDLDILKDKGFSLIYEAEDEVEGWWLKGVDLRTPDGQTKMNITTKDESRVGSETIWQKLHELQLDGKMSSLRLNRVDLKIKFKSTKKHPKGTKTFYITWKDTSSLNDIDDLDIKAGKVLKKSKIDCGFSN
jgi:hypothetical protein